MNDTLKVVEHTSGLSDTVWLAVIAALVTVATLIIKGIIAHHAEKAKTAAALEATKVTEKLEKVELKIDGRLTEILELTRKEAEERGHRMGKQEEKQEEKDRKHEAPHVAVAQTGLPDTGPVKLTITEGEIKVLPEPTKKKK